jgi:retron-type reverse transcriptase
MEGNTITSPGRTCPCPDPLHPRICHKNDPPRCGSFSMVAWEFGRPQAGSNPVFLLSLMYHLNCSLITERDIMTRVYKEWVTSLRESDLSDSKNRLMSKLVEEVRFRWERRTNKKESTFDWELEALINEITNFSFRFSPMYRSWIPKPNKPGHLRPITQPNEKDILVMDSIAFLLNLVYKDIFLDASHGFRRGRGPITFFSELHSWGQLDRLIKSDIVKCFDNINHDQLISFLLSDLGQENSGFCDLISDFLKTEILDRKGNDYSNKERGIPQGSSLSPVLMNAYLHRVDKKVSRFMETEPTLRYARYADDMIFGILKRADSEAVYKRFSTSFRESLEDLKLEASCIELLRRRPRKTIVLGLITFLGPNGTLETRAPFKRWRKKLTLAYIMGQMDPKQKMTISTFLRPLRLAIQTRIALSFCCSFLYNEKELIGYFNDLSRKRINEFQKGKRRHPNQGREITFLQSRIVHWIKLYKTKMEAINYSLSRTRANR